MQKRPQPPPGGKTAITLQNRWEVLLGYAHGANNTHLNPIWQNLAAPEQDYFSPIREDIFRDTERRLGLSLPVITHDMADMFKTCSSRRCPLRSHSLVCIGNHLFIVGIVPILNKELEFIFRSDRSDRTCVYS